MNRQQLTQASIIAENLYEFYRVFGTAKNYRLIKENNYEMIYAGDKSWPQMLFNINQNINPYILIPKISEHITSEQAAPFFIAPESYISRNHTELLKENLIIPVKILIGMNITPQKNNGHTIPPDCKISELEDDRHLADFSQLIREEFIGSNMLFNNKVLSEIKTNKEIKMTGLFSRNTLTSAMLILLKNGIAGLYFITTKKEFRNKGYATILIQFILNQLFQNGIKEVVLHANHSSFGLYQKLGFKNHNRFIIYKNSGYER